MAFSLRSFFGKGGSSNGAASTVSPPENMTPAAVPSPFQTAASNPASPNTMLFKTASAESPAGAPVALSPFAPAGETSVPGLTVGDLLPVLPADVAKNPGLSPTQSVILPDPVLESALRSGRAAVPLFELFRACPAMFLVPVGPHDSREVPLPPHKIAQLIPGNAPQNPFTVKAPQGKPTPVSPFGIVSAPREPEIPSAAPSAAATTLFNPSPFGFVTEPVQSPQPPTEFGGAPQDSNVPASPFSPAPPAAPPQAASPFVTSPAMTVSSPFSLAPEAAPAPPADGNANAAPSPASPFAAEFQSPATLPSFPSMFSGPVVQSVPGVGSASQDSSFLSATPPVLPAVASPFSLTTTATPPPAATPDSPAGPSSMPPASWGSIFPTRPAADTCPAPLPGLGDTLFSVLQPKSTAPPSDAPAPAEPPPPAFFNTPEPVAKPEPPEAPALAETPDFLDPSPAPVANAPAEASPKPFNPFERIQALAKAAENSAMPVADPFAKQPPIDTASLFGGSPLPPAAEPTAPAPLPVEQFATPAGRREKEVRLDLAASLRNCAAHDLGTSPENIPSWVQFTLSYETLASQLSTGRVVVPLETIVSGLDAPFRALFMQARTGVLVELPSNVVFHAVTEIAPTVVVPPMTPEAPALTPAAPESLLDPFAPAPDNDWKKSGPDIAPQKPFWAQPEVTAAPEPVALLDSPPAPHPMPAFTPLLREDPPAHAAPPVAPPARHESVVIPANPLTGAPEFVSPAPVLPPQGSFTTAATTRSDNATRRLLLTVLLGSPDATDAATIVKLTRQLPGVAAVFCMNNGRSIAESGDESPDARRFLRDAPSKIHGLTALASLTGIEDAETLHIRSGQVEATFCLQGAVTFAVLHDPRHREPALKEKITLLGREVAAILGESSAN